jgi:hypothetical protein
MRTGDAEYNILSLFWIFIIGSLILSSFGFNVLPLNEKKEVVTLKSGMYAMDNALLAAGSFMQTAMKYSVYQGCYEALKAGDSLPETQGKFLDNLKGRIISALNSYGQNFMFMEEYTVTLPFYSAGDITQISGTASQLTLAVNADLEMLAKAPPGTKDDITLRRNAMLGGTFDINCIGMYGKAKARNETACNALRQKLAEKIDGDSGLVKGRPVGNVQECNGMLEVVKREIESELESGNADVDVTGVTLSLRLDRGQQNKCYFTKQGASSATATLTVKDDDPNRKYPVWNGTRLAFEPLAAVFSITVSC